MDLGVVQPGARPQTRDMVRSDQYRRLGQRLDRPYMPTPSSSPRPMRPGVQRCLTSTLRPYTYTAEQAAFAKTLPTAAFPRPSPLKLAAYRLLTANCPNRGIIAWGDQGIADGFSNGYATVPNGMEYPNLKSADENPEAIDGLVLKCTSKGILAGPYPGKPHKALICEPSGAIEKAHNPEEHRIIHHFSFPNGLSVNDGIPKAAKSVELSTILDLTTLCLEHPGMWWAGGDIASMYYTFPLAPLWQLTQGLKWRWPDGKGGFKPAYFMFHVMIFGVASGPQIANNFADIVDWIFADRGIDYSLSIFDDFRIGGLTRVVTEAALRHAHSILNILGWPLNPAKDIAATQIIHWVGYEIRTVELTIGIMAATRDRYAAQFSELAAKPHYRFTITELQSLFGKLMWICRVAPQLRVFGDILLTKAEQGQATSDYRRMTGPLRDTLAYLGNVFLTIPPASLAAAAKPALRLFFHQTDASLTGGGAIHGTDAIAVRWLPALEDHLATLRPPAQAHSHKRRLAEPAKTRPDILIREMLMLFISVATFASRFPIDQDVAVEVDSAPLVAIWERGSTKNFAANQLLRAFVSFVVQHRIRLSLGYIPTLDNYGADLLSRARLDEFHRDFAGFKFRAPVLPAVGNWPIYAVGIGPAVVV